MGIENAEARARWHQRQHETGMRNKKPKPALDGTGHSMRNEKEKPKPALNGTGNSMGRE